MSLSPYFTDDGTHIRISAQQASRFAKEIAGDFNPIHDPDNKRFCVPGDLLFSLVLARQGLSRRMKFRFAGMLGRDTPLRLPAQPVKDFSLQDDKGKTYLEVTRSGEIMHDAAEIERLTRAYVAFSGCNFPHILVPLMERHGAMINTDRPLVVYECMSFDLDRLGNPDLSLELVDSILERKGKRGDALLHFRFTSGGEPIGSGSKKLLLSGLRDYRQEAVRGLVDRYAQWKADFEAG